MTSFLRAGSQLRDLQALRGVFVAREGRLLGQLAAAMKGVPSEGVFDTWMKRQSDLVQATALAYAEREVLEASMRAIEKVHLPSYLLPDGSLYLSLTSVPHSSFFECVG